MTKQQVRTSRTDQTANIPLLSLLQDISLGVDRAESSAAAIEVVVAHICRFMGWPLGHAYVWSPSSGKLISSDIWYGTDATSRSAFIALTQRTEFERGEGIIGRVWADREALFIPDLRSRPDFARRLSDAPGDLIAYFAFPVAIHDEVAAVLEFFSTEPAEPNQEIFSAIDHISALLGLTLQRQRAFHELEERQAQLEEAQQTAHVGHWEWDIVHDQVTWSSELYRIFGVAPEEMKATLAGYSQFILPADQNYVQQKISDARERGVAFDYFHRIVRPDGSVRVLHSLGRPVHDPAGEIIKLRGTVQDMTDQKEAELKLAESVRQLSAMMEIGQTISASLDMEAIYDQLLALMRPLLDAETVVLLLFENDALEVVALDSRTAGDKDDRREAVGESLPADAGIVGRAWQNRESVFVSGRACERLNTPQMNRILGHKPEAAIAVPVRWRTEPIGVLMATHGQEGSFGEEAFQLLELAAAWTAIAIGNIRQHDQLQRRLSESEALMEISSAFTKTLDLDELLRLIADRAQSIVDNADWVAIHLYNKESDALELAASSGLDIEARTYSVAGGQGFAGHVMLTGEVLSIGDVQADPRRLPIDIETNARALVVCPVENRSGRIGTISMECATPCGFDEDDQQLLTALGAQAGMAIENAQLYAAQGQARLRAERQRERMRALARRVVMAQENERARIARELHDESGQALTSLKISLGLVQEQLPPEMAATKQRLNELLELTDNTMSKLRLLSHTLRPPGLDLYGLDAALEGLCQEFQTHTQLNVIYEGDASIEAGSMPELSAYRFAQEALTNVAKHAQATEVRVTLTHDSGMIKLVVCDNGQGFTPSALDQDADQNGAGLVGMMERLEMVNGQLKVESAPGQGSCLTAIVPALGDNK